MKIHTYVHTLEGNTIVPHIAIQVREEGGKANEQFLKEVQEYFEQQRSKKPADREARHVIRGKLDQSTMVNYWTRTNLLSSHSYLQWRHYSTADICKEL